MRTLSRTHRPTGIGMRNHVFPISLLYFSGIFATPCLTKRFFTAFFRYHHPDLKFVSIAYSSLKTSDKSDDAICSFDFASYFSRTKFTVSAPISDSINEAQYLRSNLFFHLLSFLHTSVSFSVSFAWHAFIKAEWKNAVKTR